MKIFKNNKPLIKNQHWLGARRITTEAGEVEFKLQPLYKFLQVLESGENSGRRTEHLGKTCRESPDEPRDCTCCQDCEGCQNYKGSWIENSCSCYYITNEAKKTEADFQLIHSFLRAQQPNKAQKASRPMDPATASVSHTYDAQHEAEQVLQGGTEATFQVSQSLKHPANSNPLHGIPDPQPLISSLVTTEDEGRKIRAGEMSNRDLVGLKEGKSRSPINLESSGHPHLQLYSPNLVPAAYLHLLDSTKATSQYGLPDPQPPTPLSDATEDEERKARVREASNEDPQFHSPNFMLAVHPDQDWHQGHPDTTSLGKVNCPIYVVVKNFHSHPLCLCAENFNQPRISLLLGNQNLIRMRGVSNFKYDTLTIESKDERLCSPTHPSREPNSPSPALLTKLYTRCSSPSRRGPWSTRCNRRWREEGRNIGRKHQHGD